ncbi:unnamed protein product, partial [Mesorhabditis spiculigera]
MSVIVPNDKDAMVSVDDINEHSCESGDQRRKRPKPVVTDLDKPLLKRDTLQFLPTSELSLAFLSSQLAASQPLSPCGSSDGLPSALVQANELDPLPSSKEGLARFLNQISCDNHSSTPSPSEMSEPWQCVDCEVIDFSKVPDGEMTHVLRIRCTYSHYTMAIPLISPYTQSIIDALSQPICLFDEPERLRFDPSFKNGDLRDKLHAKYPGIELCFYTRDDRTDREDHSSLRRQILGWLMESGVQSIGWAKALPQISLEYNRTEDIHLHTTPIQRFFRRRTQRSGSIESGRRADSHEAFSDFTEGTDETSPEPAVEVKPQI